MEMDSKMIAFIIVGVLVGAAAGVGIGYAVFNEEAGVEYAIYLDYGEAADKDHVDGWVKVNAISAVDALKEATELDYENSASMGTFIKKINGVGDDGSTKYWNVFIFNGDWKSENDFGKSWSASNVGIDNVECTKLYFVWQNDGEIPESGWATA